MFKEISKIESGGKYEEKLVHCYSTVFCDKS